MSKQIEMKQVKLKYRHLIVLHSQKLEKHYCKIEKYFSEYTYIWPCISNH